MNSSASANATDEANSIWEVDGNRSGTIVLQSGVLVLVLALIPNPDVDCNACSKDNLSVVFVVLPIIAAVANDDNDG